MPKSKNLLILLIYLAVVLLTTNINAVVDHFLHPDIPYFHEEHLIVGATNGLISTLLFVLVVQYISRLQHSLRRNEAVLAANRKLIGELEEAAAKVKLLSGLLPICAACKKIRNEQGGWTQIETYIRNHSNADFTHSLCPPCAKRLYPFLHLDEHNKPE